jgi:hypothetical protein
LAADFHEAASGGQFRAATFAGPITGDLGSGRVAEKFAIFAEGRFHPANGPAIDMRGFDGHKKASVETGIPCQHCLVTMFRIQNHDALYPKYKKDARRFRTSNFLFFIGTFL